jgi:adenylate cyclase
MIPEFIPYYGIGPFFGLAANAVMAVLCLVILALYRNYRPLRSLFLFYLLSTSFFLGGFIYGLQRSPESILLGYRIDLASVALLPAGWALFISDLFDKKLDRFSHLVMAMSLILAALALFGSGPSLLGLPLESHRVAINILRPQSKLLRPFIHTFCMTMCLYYFWLIITRLWSSKGQGQVYLFPVAAGLLSWLLGGLNDAMRSAGIVLLSRDQILWFTSLWLSMFLTIAVALHFRSLERAVREARDVFEKFVPPAYLRRIAARGLGSIRLGEADQQYVTVLCCDIRGFTALSERLSPSQLIAVVNRLYEGISRVAEKYHGVIDKFLGDAVLCLFEGPDSTGRAVACGVQTLSAVKSFNEGERHEANHEVRIGIGLHAGPVILGTIGSPDRMDSTVLGLTVNLAKRIEALTRPLELDMIVSSEVVKRLPDGHGHRFRNLGKVLIKGSSEPMEIMEVYDQDPSEIQSLKDRLGPIMTEGIDLVRGGRLPDALQKLKEAQTIFPQDNALHLLIALIRDMLEKGQTDGREVLLDFR